MPRAAEGPGGVAGGAAEQSRHHGRDRSRSLRVTLAFQDSPSLLSVQEPKPKHILVFQHIPLYLQTPEEEDDYFNLQKATRRRLLDRFKEAGRVDGGAGPVAPLEAVTEGSSK